MGISWVIQWFRPWEGNFHLHSGFFWSDFVYWHIWVILITKFDQKTCSGIILSFQKKKKKSFQTNIFQGIHVRSLQPLNLQERLFQCFLAYSNEISAIRRLVAFMWQCRETHVHRSCPLARSRTSAMVGETRRWSWKGRSCWLTWHLPLPALRASCPAGRG